ncbi:hypothetical protein GCM10020255_014990 [Rhodococcus baikonurensis]
MTETLDPMAETEVDQKQLAEQLLAQAKEQGVELMGPNGLLNQLTKNVLETALDAEMTEHLGYEKHDAAAAAAATRGTVPVRRRCSLRSGRWRSKCHATSILRSTRRLLRSVSDT